jgi:thioredoxin-like negative regulator of GroEL
MDVSTIDKLRASARDVIRKLDRVCDDDDVVDAKKLVEALRNVAAYDEMGQLAEAISRRDPKDAKNRRLYAQYLINTGKATAAIDLLTPLKERLPEEDPEFAEAMGLIGRQQANFLRCGRQIPAVRSGSASTVRRSLSGSI